MSDLILFKNQNLKIGKFRVIDKNGEPWFVAKDVAKILGYSDTEAMTRRLDDDEISTYTDKSSGQVRYLKIINENCGEI